jgi:hypothetical protein
MRVFGMRFRVGSAKPKEAEEAIMSNLPDDIKEAAHALANRLARQFAEERLEPNVVINALMFFLADVALNSADPIATADQIAQLIKTNVASGRPRDVLH